MHPYPESLALKSLSICILAVENSWNIACKEGKEKDQAIEDNCCIERQVCKLQQDVINILRLIT